MTPKVFYAGYPGDGTGWGICNKYLIQELGKLVELDFGHPCDRIKNPTSMDVMLSQHIVFQPIADHNLNPSTGVEGWKNIGYTFFEFPLGPRAKENSKQYDLIFCGSTWCQDRLKERGIESKVLIQGVDHSIFKPGDGRKPDGETWIFSGGKFEYRKGQDLVLAAFKEVLKRHPKARLVTAWQNPWPELCETMRDSKHIKYEMIPGEWVEQLGHLCQINDIPKDRVLTVPGILPNAQMAGIYRQCDFGVFPNRCEGGTNLVMMEFMACGKAVVANMGTGHGDLDDGIAFAVGGILDERNWVVPSVKSIIGNVNYAIDNRDGLAIIGNQTADYMKQWTWERAARTIVENL